MKKTVLKITSLILALLSLFLLSSCKSIEERRDRQAFTGENNKTIYYKDTKYVSVGESLFDDLAELCTKYYATEAGEALESEPEYYVFYTAEDAIGAFYVSSGLYNLTAPDVPVLLSERYGDTLWGYNAEDSLPLLFICRSGYGSIFVREDAADDLKSGRKTALDYAEYLWCDDPHADSDYYDEKAVLSAKVLDAIEITTGKLPSEKPYVNGADVVYVCSEKLNKPNENHTEEIILVRYSPDKMFILRDGKYYTVEESEFEVLNDVVTKYGFYTEYGF